MATDSKYRRKAKQGHQSTIGQDLNVTTTQQRFMVLRGIKAGRVTGRLFTSWPNMNLVDRTSDHLYDLVLRMRIA